MENLFAAWQEFRRGKARRCDVQEFEFNLEDNIFDLHYSLKDGTWRHGNYQSFYVCDPKRRHIHKACVRDRLLHHAVVRVIEQSFERQFIFDSWSCRTEKGTHRAVERFQKLAWRLSRNNTKTVWILKLDIEKFFASVDQEILSAIIARTIQDEKATRIIREIIGSFSPGLPLGNLTSQLFANVFLNELDKFIKYKLLCESYVRYCDDFILINREKGELVRYLGEIKVFLAEGLKVSLRCDKIVLDRYHRGIDFLGFICFPHFRILRTKTKWRILKRVNRTNLASYLGLLKRCRSGGIERRLKHHLCSSV